MFCKAMLKLACIEQFPWHSLLQKKVYMSQRSLIKIKIYLSRSNKRLGSRFKMKFRSHYFFQLWSLEVVFVFSFIEDVYCGCLGWNMLGFFPWSLSIPLSWCRWGRWQRSIQWLVDKLIDLLWRLNWQEFNV